jgi:hypothetical protein
VYNDVRIHGYYRTLFLSLLLDTFPFDSSTVHIYYIIFHIR